ncbi:MAG: hypothetical protein LBQ28_03870 [Prevotellaceae bacterium]|jgi:hypothetical protein|nr:hypothetical protein [Prevotellaceae bacterium]
MKTFTKLLFFAVFLLSLQAVQAQQTEPRPEWVRKPPFPPTTQANHIFVYGMGTGKTETEAELGAWKNALYSAFNEGGLLNVTTQAITLNKAVSLDSLNFLLDANRLQRRRVCQTLPITMITGEIKVYVLLQVLRDARVLNDFYNYPIAIDCESDDFREEVNKWNADRIKIKSLDEMEAELSVKEKNLNKLKTELSDNERRLNKLQTELFEKEKAVTVLSNKDDKIKKLETAITKLQDEITVLTREGKGHWHDYFAWGVISSGYPLHFSTSFLGRHGGRNFGIGYSLSLGVERAGLDFGGKNDANNIYPFHYSAGIKLFPYRQFFISGGYSTLGCKKVNRFNDNEGRWGTSGIRQGKGFYVTAGVDALLNKPKTKPIISLELGMSYDTFTKKWEPLLIIKWGLAWRW